MPKSHERVRVPRYEALKPKSPAASAAGRGASFKRDTKPEILLRRTLWSRGLRYRIDSHSLPGKPDLVFRSAKVVVFCDGDFWHGRNLEAWLGKLGRGHNADYWVAKLKRNVQRDQENNTALQEMGWFVLRYWETDILSRTETIADEISAIVATNRATRGARHGSRH